MASAKGRWAPISASNTGHGRSMCENVLLAKPGEVELGARRKELEGRFGERHAVRDLVALERELRLLDRELAAGDLVVDASVAQLVGQVIVGFFEGAGVSSAICSARVGVCEQTLRLLELLLQLVQKLSSWITQQLH